jgi:hypothetical protein
MYDWFSRRRSGGAFEIKNFVLDKQTQPSDQTLLRCEIAVFAVEFVILKREEREFGALFIAIRRFFENQHVLSLGGGGRTHDSLHLRLRHAVGDLVIIGQGQLRTGEHVAIAPWCQREE